MNRNQALALLNAPDAIIRRLKTEEGLTRKEIGERFGGLDEKTIYKQLAFGGYQLEETPPLRAIPKTTPRWDFTNENINVRD